MWHMKTKQAAVHGLKALAREDLEAEGMTPYCIHCCVDQSLSSILLPSCLMSLLPAMAT